MKNRIFLKKNARKGRWRKTIIKDSTIQCRNLFPLSSYPAVASLRNPKATSAMPMTAKASLSTASTSLAAVVAVLKIIFLSLKPSYFWILNQTLGLFFFSLPHDISQRLLTGGRKYKHQSPIRDDRLSLHIQIPFLVIEQIWYNYIRA